MKPDNMTMAQFALRWILIFEAVTCAIPGAKRPSQVQDNAAADFPHPPRNDGRHPDHLRFAHPPPSSSTLATDRWRVASGK
ncbi:MAG: aldo/keto reductase [Chloroflexi bacterium]|nr:aldo/keto reductase [Chloroflexota bacterium]